MSRSLPEIVAGADVLLLDFDGPVCSTFAGYPAPVVANELRNLVAARGVTITDDLARANGPDQFLRATAALGDPELARAVMDALRDAETTAVATAEPTPGAHDVLRLAHEAGLPVAIVSNNADQAIHAYLELHNLTARVAHVVGRHDGMDIRRLKPDDYLIRRALHMLSAGPDRAVFVGDSTTDIEAGRAAGVATIGYLNKPGKRERLAAVGADTVIDTMTEIADALSQAPTPDRQERIQLTPGDAPEMSIN